MARVKNGTTSKETAPRGEKHFAWKGNKVGYVGLHM